MKRMYVVLALTGALVVLLAPVLYAQWQQDVRLTTDPNQSTISWNGARGVATNGSDNLVHVVWTDKQQGDNATQIYYKRSTNRGVTWEPQQRLTTDQDHYSGFPSIGYSPQGKVHIVFVHQDDNGASLYYIRSQNGGGSWDSPQLIKSSGVSTPSVAVSPTNQVHVVWSGGVPPTSPDIYYIRSLDGGYLWDGLASISPEPTASVFPSVAVSSQGFVHVVWEDYRITGYTTIWHCRSQNNGGSWDQAHLLQDAVGAAHSPSVSVSPQRWVHVVWDNVTGLYYKRSTDDGDSWPSGRNLTTSGWHWNEPQVAVSPLNEVHVVWWDQGSIPAYVNYIRSLNGGTNWQPKTRLTVTSQNAWHPHVAVSSSPPGEVHVVWEDYRDTPGCGEIYYKRNPSTQGFAGCLTDSSHARHLLRDPTRSVLHLVIASEEDSVYYSRSTNGGLNWSLPINLGKGKNPSIGLAVLPEDIYPPFISVCVAYRGGFPNGDKLIYTWNDNLSDPGSGDITHWHPYIFSSTSVGEPSVTTWGQRVYVAYRSTQSPNFQLECRNFNYDATDFSPVEVIDTDDYANQPSLCVDAAGLDVRAAWQRGTEIYYAPRGGNLLPPWYPSTWRLVDQTGDPSQQPFIECYGDQVYVAWSDGQPAPSDVWRANRPLSGGSWTRYNASNSSSASESPAQAFGEFTTWSEGTSGQPDIYYYSPNAYWGRGAVESNIVTWSYWPHSQMTYTVSSGAYLWSAWTESPTPSLPPFTVLTKQSYFPPPPPPGGGDSFGSYYSVQAGQDTPSIYCRKRDGVLRFSNWAVDFSRDSLVYVLPYLNLLYDYYVKIASYRESGSNWAQAISLDGQALRTVQFAPSVVDTVWLRIPRALYRQDHKVVFSAKNVRGDYVTSLGMVLYQVDPSIRGGGPQSSGTASIPVREVFSAYPNPVTSLTRVEYSLKASGSVNLSVYDLAGRLVQKIVDANQSAGVHRATWDGKGENGRSLSSGIYFLRLSTPERIRTARIVVVK